MSNIIISPSILSADFMNLETEIEAVEQAGANWLHIDVMDGHFVPNISIGIPVVKSIREKTNMFLDTHLMISEPLRYIEKFISAGSDLITFHYEACENDDEVFEIINIIKKFGKKAGISIKPKTEPEEIYKFLDKIDLLLVMTVEPGFGGQKFMHDCALKIPKIKKRANKHLVIQVDGGVNSVTANLCKQLGATSLVAGSYIYNSDNYKKRLSSLMS